MTKFSGILNLVLAAIIAFLLFRQCGASDGASDVKSTSADTSIVSTPGGLKTPPMPSPIFSFDTLQAAYYRNRYAAYKRQAAVLATQLERLRLIFADSTLSCEQRTAIFAFEFENLKLEIWEKSVLIGDLQQSLEQQAGQVNTYAGRDSTADYLHTWKIAAHGTIEPGGYQYQTDVFKKVVTLTERVEVLKWRKNRISPLFGLQSAPGGEWLPVYGAQYERSGRRVGLLGQVGHLPGVGEWQGVVGLTVGW